MNRSWLITYTTYASNPHIDRERKLTSCLVFRRHVNWRNKTKSWQVTGEINPTRKILKYAIATRVHVMHIDIDCFSFSHLSIVQIVRNDMNVNILLLDCLRSTWDVHYSNGQPTEMSSEILNLGNVLHPRSRLWIY